MTGIEFMAWARAGGLLAGDVLARAETLLAGAGRPVDASELLTALVRTGVLTERAARSLWEGAQQVGQADPRTRAATTQSGTSGREPSAEDARTVQRGASGRVGAAIPGPSSASGRVPAAGEDALTVQRGSASAPGSSTRSALATGTSAPAPVGRGGEASSPLEARYTLEGELGKGGNGIVLAARDLSLRREVAIKLLLDPQDMRAQGDFMEEAQITGQLEHPGVVPVHEVGCDPKRGPYLAMKRVRGRTYRAVIAEAHARLKAKETTWAAEERKLLEVLLRVCEAVAYAHEQGVLHRDLKPSNVMVGEFGEVHLMDWGLARATGQVTSDRGAQGAAPSREGEVVGTPQYMAPEQAAGAADLDGRADVYSLGAVLYTVLAGRPPFGERKSTESVLDAVRQGSWPPPQNFVAWPVPRALAAIQARAMAHDPVTRYADVVSLRADLDAYLAGQAVQAAAHTHTELLRLWARRNRTLVLGVASTALMALLGIGAVAVVQTRAAETARQAEQKARTAEAGARAAEAAAKAAEGVSRRYAQQTEEARAHADERADAAILAEADARRLLARALTEKGTRALAADDPQSAAVLFAAALERHEMSDVRGLLLQALSRCWSASILAGHVGVVTLVRWSPDGRRLASGSRDGTVAVWEPGARRKVTSISLGQEAKALAWSPDGVRLAVGCGRFVALADPADWRTRGAIRTLEVTASACAVEWSQDGQFLLAASEDGTARVWEAATGRLAFSRRSTHSKTPVVALAPDRPQLAFGDTSSLELVDLGTGQTVATLAAGGLEDMAWAPDGQTLAMSSYYRGGALRLAMRNGASPSDVGLRLMPVHAGDSSGSVAVAWSPDGSRVATIDRASSVRIWSKSGFLERDLSLGVLAGAGPSPFGNKVSWSPDGRFLIAAAADSGTHAALNVMIRSTGSWRPVSVLRRVASAFPSKSMAFDWSPDGTRVATGDATDSLVRVWKTEGASGYRRLDEVTPGARGLHWNPAPDHSAVLAISASNQPLRLWAPEKGTLEGRLGEYVAGWSPDGRLLASATRHDVQLVDRELRPVGQPLRHPGPIMALAWSPDGKRLACAVQSDGSIRIWDVEHRVMLRTLKGHRRVVQGLSWSSDGDWLASISHDAYDNTVRVWDPSREAPGTILQLFATRLAWDPVLPRLAVGTDSGLIIAERVGQGWRRQTLSMPDAHGLGTLAWHGPRLLARTHKALYLWQGLEGSAQRLDLPDRGLPAEPSPDGRLLAILTQDGTSIEILEIEGGAIRAIVPGTDRVHSLAWSFDGLRLACTRESAIEVWTVDELLRPDASRRSFVEERTGLRVADLEVQPRSHSGPAVAAARTHMLALIERLPELTDADFEAGVGKLRQLVEDPLIDQASLGSLGPEKVEALEAVASAWRRRLVAAVRRPRPWDLSRHLLLVGALRETHPARALGPRMCAALDEVLVAAAEDVPSAEGDRALWLNEVLKLDDDMRQYLKIAPTLPAAVGEALAQALEARPTDPALILASLGTGSSLDLIAKLQRVLEPGVVASLERTRPDDTRTALCRLIVALRAGEDRANLPDLLRLAERSGGGDVALVYKGWVWLKRGELMAAMADHEPEERRAALLRSAVIELRRARTTLPQGDSAQLLQFAIMEAELHRRRLGVAGAVAAWSELLADLGSTTGRDGERVRAALLVEAVGHLQRQPDLDSETRTQVASWRSEALALCRGRADYPPEWVRRLNAERD